MRCLSSQTRNAASKSALVRVSVPAAAIVVTGLLSAVLVLSGTFEQLLTYVVFMSWLWFALAALAIFAYRRRDPQACRPFRTPGYPVTPILFVAAAILIVVNTMIAQPVESIIGLGLAAGKSGQEMLDFYCSEGASIFGTPRRLTRFTRAKYHRGPLEELLHRLGRPAGVPDGHRCVWAQA